MVEFLLVVRTHKNKDGFPELNAVCRRKAIPLLLSGSVEAGTSPHPHRNYRKGSGSSIHSRLAFQEAPLVPDSFSQALTIENHSLMVSCFMAFVPSEVCTRHVQGTSSYSGPLQEPGPRLSRALSLLQYSATLRRAAQLLQ